VALHALRPRTPKPSPTHCCCELLLVRALRQSAMRTRNSVGGAARKPLRLRLSTKPSTSCAALLPLTNHFLEGCCLGPLPAPPVLPLQVLLLSDATHSSRAAEHACIQVWQKRRGAFATTAADDQGPGVPAMRCVCPYIGNTNTVLDSSLLRLLLSRHMLAPMALSRIAMYASRLQRLV